MIRQFRNILFYSDGARGELAALRRACAIAEHNGASLTVLAVVDAVSTNDPRLESTMSKLQGTLIRDRGLAVDKLIADIGAFDRNHLSITKTVVAGKPHVEVISAVKSEQYDLLVKSVRSSSALSGLFGTDDIRLLHFCPCPVMILKPGRRASWRSVLVSVDPHVETPVEESLNHSLLDLGASIAEREGAALHLLHVQEKALKGHQVDAEVRKSVEQSQAAAATASMDEMHERVSHVEMQKHLVKGEPHKAIAKFVETHDVDLLVMGSVARSGIPGFFVGNTAEKILEHVDCSVVVLKPEGWSTPVS